MGDNPDQSKQGQEIQIGDAVEIFGLTRAPELNGQCGRAVAFLEATERFVVELSAYEDSKAVKAANLRKLAAPELTAEEKITKRYAFDPREAQEGTFGVGKVHIATDREAHGSTLGRRVAIKNLEIADRGVRREFVREIESMKELCHPNICNILETYMEDRTVWVVTEYCTGGTAFQEIGSNGMEERMVAEIVCQVASALKHSHGRGIAHRDLRPESICFCSSMHRMRGSVKVKVTDWGVGFHLHRTDATSAARDTFFTAPEVLQAGAKDRCGPACDLWSLGVTTYVLLCGKLPFWGALHEQLWQMNAESYWMGDGAWKATSEEAKGFVRSLLKADPAARLPIDEAPRWGASCSELGAVLPMWEPTLGDVPRPEWLPKTGPGNMHVSPEFWGMTLRQFCAVIMACFMGDEQRGGGRISRFAEKKPGKTQAKHANHVTLYDINNKFVKPWTRNLGSSIALLLNNKRPLKAQLMVSHSWAEDVIEAMVALLGQMFSMGLTLDASIWFCTFAQYQPGDEPGDCGPGVASQLGLDPFRRVIESGPVYGMIVLHTSRAEVYARLWCVYEVNEAIDSKVESRAAVSMDYLVEHYLKRTCDGLSSEELSRVSTYQAQCSSKQDADMIHHRIMDTHGYDNLDKTIGAFRRSAIDRMDEAAVSFFRWADEHRPFEGDEQRTVCILRDKARTAGIYVGLHCLLSECRKSEHPPDQEYLGRILRLAKMAISPLGLYMYADGRHPPMFDPTKASVEQLDKLLPTAGAGGEDDSFLLDCLSDLGNFPLPIAYLEMSTGGSSKVDAATVAVAGLAENLGVASPPACCVCS